MRDLDDYQKKYISEPGEKVQVKYRRKAVLSIMNRYSHHNILEVGCGMDPLFLYLSEMSDIDSVTIIEPGHVFIENAKKKAIDARTTVKCIEGYFEQSIDILKKENTTYDYIIVSSLLHELENPNPLMDALMQVADNNTVIHINVPNARSLHKYIAKEMELIDDIYALSDQQKMMQRNRVYDIDSLATYVTNMGFDVLESGSYFPKFLTGAQYDSMLEAKIISEVFFDGLYGIGKLIPEYGSEIYVQVRKHS